MISKHSAQSTSGARAGAGAAAVRGYARPVDEQLQKEYAFEVGVCSAPLGGGGGLWANARL